MSKKILLIIGILVIVGIAAFLILTSKPASGPGGNTVGFSIRDYLPFGNSGNGEISTTTETTPAEGNASNSATSEAGRPIPRLENYQVNR